MPSLNAMMNQEPMQPLGAPIREKQEPKPDPNKEFERGNQNFPDGTKKVKLCATGNTVIYRPLLLPSKVLAEIVAKYGPITGSSS